MKNLLQRLHNAGVLFNIIADCVHLIHGKDYVTRIANDNLKKLLRITGKVKFVSVPKVCFFMKFSEKKQRKKKGDTAYWTGRKFIITTLKIKRILFR